MDYIGWSWLLIIVVCIIIEALTISLTTTWFAIGALIAWFVSLIGLSLQTQIIIFLLVSIICLIFTRPIAIKKLKIGKAKTDLDLLIGKCVKVKSTINNLNNEGTVVVNGLEWTARSFNDEIIEKDEIVCVREIKGVKLIVELKK
ncbi:MAG: NfeD family protein [Bacillota bacterium]|nr:NfeD family protein [Bacillota bacterium]